MSQTNWTSLERHVRRKVPSLLPTITMLRAACTAIPQTAANEKLIKAWKPLLTVMASFSSICPILPMKHTAVANALSTGTRLDRQVPVHKDFIAECPVLADICQHYKGMWPANSYDLLKEIIKISKVPFMVPNANQEEAAPISNLEFWQEGHWYPHWPRIRKAKTYSNYYTAVPEPVNGEFLLITSKVLY